MIVWHGDRALGHLELRAARSARELLDRMPIAIARREVHLREVAVGAQDGIDEAHALEDRGPIERGDEAHARDHVADGDVHPDLALVFLADDRLGGRTLAREALVQPDQRRRDPRVLIAQALEQSNNEGRRQARRVEAAQRRVWRLRRPAADAEQAIGQRVSLLPSNSVRRRSARPIAAGFPRGRCAA